MIRLRRPERMHEGLRLAWLLAAVLTLHPLPATAQGRFEVTDLEFEGNETFSDKELATAIDTRQTACRSVVLAPFCWAGAGFAEAPAFFSPRALQRDVARLVVFYYRQGYREALVDTTLTVVDSARLAVRFTIAEGQPVIVGSLTVEGIDDLDPAIVEDLPLEERRPLSLLALDATRQLLTARLRNRGYAYADVLQNYFIPADSPYVARVVYDIDPGPAGRFGPLFITGNEKISDQTVRRMLPFQEGDPYSHDAVLTGQRNLYGLEIFQHAQITERMTFTPDSIIPLEVAVNEGDVHRIRTGGGWSTAECFGAEGRWISRNFFKGARRLQLRLRLDNLGADGLNASVCPQAGSGVYGQVNWQVTADFTQPWVFSPRNTLALGIYTERRSIPDIFVREGVGVNAALIRSLTRSTTAAISYRPQLSTLEAAGVIWCANYLVCTSTEIEVLEEPNWLSPAGFNLTRDTRNNLLNPTSGSRLLVDYELADRWTGSNFAYQRLIGEISVARRLPGWVGAVRLRAGFVRPRSFAELTGGGEATEIAHPQKRFYGGGAQSVRGYAQNQLGPKVLTTDVQNLLGALEPDEVAVVGVAGAACQPEEVVDLSCDASPLFDNRFIVRPTGGRALVEGSAEARFPLFGPRVEGAAYVDFGQVVDESESIAFDNLVFTPGVGVRYFTPIGPIRVDVAYRFTGGEELDVLTEQIREFDPERDQPAARLLGADGAPIDWVRTDELAPLATEVLFNESRALTLSRFQLHLSIGQAF